MMQVSNRVVFDIGHGSDTWPPAKGVKLLDGSSFAEHSFNSAVAVMAKSLAEIQGFEVLFTQDPNKPCINLGTRTAWVNSEHKKNPILCLVSFHANASGDPKATGWGVFHWHSSTKGKQLAELWAKHAKALFPIKPWGKGIWQCKPGEWTNFDIVRKPVVPCILIEHFFFTNPDELKKCNTSEFINIAAVVVVRALCEYAGITYKEKDPIPEYKQIIQEHCKFSYPDGVWAVLDVHPHPEALYKQLAESYNKTPG